MAYRTAAPCMCNWYSQLIIFDFSVFWAQKPFFAMKFNSKTPQTPFLLFAVYILTLWCLLRNEIDLHVIARNFLRVDKTPQKFSKSSELLEKLVKKFETLININ